MCPDINNLFLCIIVLVTFLEEKDFDGSRSDGDIDPCSEGDDEAL